VSPNVPLPDYATHWNRVTASEWERAIDQAQKAEKEALEYVRQKFAEGDTLVPLSTLSWISAEPVLAPVAKGLRKKLRAGRIPLYRITNRTLAFESDLCHLLGASLEELSESLSQMVRRTRASRRPSDEDQDR
jgi:hypothetical protein